MNILKDLSRKVVASLIIFVLFVGNIPINAISVEDVIEPEETGNYELGEAGNVIFTTQQIEEEISKSTEQAKNFIGKTVTNYNAGGLTYQILDAQDGHIYLIAKENAINLEENVSLERLNLRQNWNKYVDISKGASYAIGTPTINQFINSWNKTHTIKLYYNKRDYVYAMDENDKRYQDFETAGFNGTYYNGYNYGLIDNDSLDGTVSKFFTVTSYNIQYGYDEYHLEGIRPVVCLESNVNLLQTVDERGNIQYAIESNIITVEGNLTETTRQPILLRISVLNCTSEIDYIKVNGITLEGNEFYANRNGTYIIIVILKDGTVLKEEIEVNNIEISTDIILINPIEEENILDGIKINGDFTTKTKGPLLIEITGINATKAVRTINVNGITINGKEFYATENGVYIIIIIFEDGTTITKEVVIDNIDGTGGNTNTDILFVNPAVDIDETIKITGDITTETEEDILLTITGMTKEVEMITVNGIKITGDSFYATENGTYIIVIVYADGTVVTKKIEITNITKTVRYINPASSIDVLIQGNITTKTSESILLTVSLINSTETEEYITVNGIRITGNKFYVNKNGVYIIVIVLKDGTKITKEIQINNIEIKTDILLITPIENDNMLDGIDIRGTFTTQTKGPVLIKILGIDTTKVVRTINVNGITINGEEFYATENGVYIIIIAFEDGTTVTKEIVINNIEGPATRPELNSGIKLINPATEPTETIEITGNTTTETTEDILLTITGITKTVRWITVNGIKITGESFYATENGTYIIVVILEDGTILTKKIEITNIKREANIIRAYTGDILVKGNTTVKTTEAVRLSISLINTTEIEESITVNGIKLTGNIFYAKRNGIYIIVIVLKDGTTITKEIQITNILDGEEPEEKTDGPLVEPKGYITIDIDGNTTIKTTEKILFTIKISNSLKRVVKITVNGQETINNTFYAATNGLYVIIITLEDGTTITREITVTNIYVKCIKVEGHPDYSSSETECPICALIRKIKVTKTTEIYTGGELGITYDNPEGLTIVVYYDGNKKKPVNTGKYEYEIKIIYDGDEYETGLTGEFTIIGKAGEPDDGDSKPDDGEGKPDDGDSKPDDGEGKPDDGDSKPDDGEGKPDDGNGKTQDGVGTGNSSSDKSKSSSTGVKSGTLPYAGSTNMISSLLIVTVIIIIVGFEIFIYRKK